MKFKFSYEKLEEYHKQQEEIAQRDYIESLSRLESEKAKLNALYEKQEEAIGEAYKIRETESAFSQGWLVSIEEFLKGLESRIETQRQVVINHHAICDQKQEILIQAAREHKTYQKLREKQFAEFKKKEKKKEMKAVDELVVTRFKRSEVA
ncbi:MAG: flagellar export protein FliJ [Oligoflexia bacterium]|nr:flagellar export protein FliJ [Oligoflexia bacterium]